jgi:hypothetical protein
MTPSTGFAEAAQVAFSFLESAGFRLVEQENARLGYESDQTLFSIEWDVRSGELNIFVGLKPRKGEKRDSFSLSDLLRMEGVDAPESLQPFQVSEEERLPAFLGRLAEDTRVHASSALAGDRMFFRRLEIFRNSQSSALLRDMTVRRVRLDADEAWRARDFNRVVDLYSLIGEEMNQAEKGRLEYARRHQQQS